MAQQIDVELVVQSQTVEIQISGYRPASGGGGGAVDSVFGRTEDVVAEAGDYNDTQISVNDDDWAAYGITGSTVHAIFTSILVGFTATITNILTSLSTKFDKSTDDLDDITAGTTNKHFTQTEKTKLSGIEAGAEVNNISDANATDLTDGNDTTLHKHDDRYYTESETDTLLSAKQAADADLTTIAALDSTQSGVIASDGAGWVSKTYSALKTALGLTKSDVGLGNVDNTSDANKPVSTAQQTAIDAKVADAINNGQTTIAPSQNAVFDALALKLDTTAYDDATAAETNTGTSTAKYVSPDGLAGSYAGTKNVSLYVVEGTTAPTTGDGKAYFRIPSALNGMNLVSCSAAVVTASTSGTPTIQLARGRQANASSAHTFADMLSTRITIDVNEFDSKDATTAAVIDAANDDVATGDLIRVDIDTAGTSTKGLIVTLTFQLP